LKVHSIAFGLTVWRLVAWHYIWPALRDQPGLGNLKLILLVHAFRFLALAFVVPVCCISGVTDQICSVDSLPRFRKRHSGFARTGYTMEPAQRLWRHGAFNIFGTADLAILS
jgi:hypothetical protein